MNVLRTLEPKTRKDLGVLFTTGLLFWSSLASLLPILPLYIESLKGTSQDIGIVMGAFAIGLLVFRAQIGRIADQRGRKGVLFLGMGVATLAPLGYYFVQSIPLLIAIRAFHGISIAAFTTAYSALVVDISPERTRGELIGYMTLVNPLGVAIGPALGGWVQAWAGYGPMFLISSALGMVGLVCTMQVQESQTMREVPPRDRTVPERFWSMLFEPRMRIPAIVLLIVGIAFGTLSTFAPLLIKESQVGLNPGLFYTAAAVASFSVRLFTGRASDRYGRGLFMTISLLLYAVSMVILWSATSATAFLVGAFLEGAGAGMLIPMTAALLADRSHPHERGRTFGLCMVGFDLGMAIAGPTLGSVADQIGYRNVFGVVAILVCLDILIFLIFSSKDPRRSFQFALGQGQDLYALPRA
ncbi:MAG: MFS transporter [Leptolyngbyaceae cyanobacterium bins.59]|nr:MFS transporter [Leptolyngbyaceae cyanobacterium bins.59]